MDVILALGVEIRKMFLSDAVLSIAAVALVVALRMLVRSGSIGSDLAPYLLMIGVALVLIVAINIALLRIIRKTDR